MHSRVREFVEMAEEQYGLTVDPVEFPEKGTPTAADAAEAVECPIGAIVNSLVFSVGGELVLCLTSGAETVDESALAAWAGVDEAAVSIADPEQVREATGWAIGAVPPIGHETDLKTLFDPSLLDFDRVWAAAGTSTSMWAIEPNRLRDVVGAEAVEFTV